MVLLTIVILLLLFVFYWLFKIVQKHFFKNLKLETKWFIKRLIITELLVVFTFALVPLNYYFFHFPHRLFMFLIFLLLFAIGCFAGGIFTERFARSQGKNAKWFMLAIYVVGFSAFWLITEEKVENFWKVIIGAFFIGALIIHFWAMDNLKRKQKLKGEKKNGEY